MNPTNQTVKKNLIEAVDAPQNNYSENFARYLFAI